MTTPTIKIGWSQESITPEQPVNLFGMFNERISTHVEELMPDFDPDKLLLSCAHTYNAPNFRGDLFPPPPPEAMPPEAYRAFFVERVANAAVRAWN